MNPVTLSDVRVYQTLSQEYRAYVSPQHPAHGLATNVWGTSRADALAKLARVLAAMDIPFDLEVQS